MKITSRRDNFFRVIIFGAIFLCLIPMAMFYQINGLTLEYLIGIVVITLVAGLLVWIWHGTYYTILNHHLKYYSGPFRGSIDIKNIDKITINKTSYVGLKYGLARNGIILESSSHIQLYITPTQPEAFVKRLIAVNSDIKITT